MIGKTISHYRILEKIGSGGMGIVYKAQDTKLDRFVALKFLTAQFGEDEEEKQRFIQEAKAASALQHNNIYIKYHLAKALEGAGQTDQAMKLYDDVATWNFNGIGAALTRKEAMDKAKKMSEMTKK